MGYSLTFFHYILRPTQKLRGAAAFCRVLLERRVRLNSAYLLCQKSQKELLFANLLSPIDDTGEV